MTEFIGPYPVEAELGRGGMGRVVRSTHPRLQIPVAVKELLELDPDLLARFEREAQVLGGLRHPGIVGVLEWGASGGRPYVVMEYCPGQDLRRALRERGRLSPQEAGELVVALATALEAVHGRGIVHRDLKPENVLLTPLGPRITDFGLARTTQVSGLTASGVLLGTPAYMSPEQIEDPRRVDARSDLFALGVILYELLAGTRPFQGGSALAVALAVQNEQPPPLSGAIPAAVRAVVERALAKDPAARFPNAQAFGRALERALHGVGGEPELGASRRGAGTLALALVAGALGAAGWLLLRPGGAGSPGGPSPSSTPPTSLPTPSAGAAPRAWAERLAGLDELGALALLERAAAEDPADLQLRLLLCERCLRTGRRERALGLARELAATEALSGRERARAALIEVELLPDPSPEARRPLLERALELAPPGSFEATLARVWGAEAVFEAAWEHREALRGDPWGVEWVAQSGLARADAAVAERALEELRRSEPGSLRALRVGLLVAIARRDLAAQERLASALWHLLGEEGQAPSVVTTWINFLAQGSRWDAVRAWSERFAGRTTRHVGAEGALALLAVREDDLRRASAPAARLLGEDPLTLAAARLRELGASQAEIEDVVVAGLAPWPPEAPKVPPEWEERLARLGPGRAAFAEAVLGACVGEGWSELEAEIERARGLEPGLGVELLRGLLAHERGVEAVAALDDAVGTGDWVLSEWRAALALGLGRDLPMMRASEPVASPLRRRLEELRARASDPLLRADLSARLALPGAVAGHTRVAVLELFRHGPSGVTFAMLDRARQAGGVLHADVLAVRLCVALERLEESRLLGELGARVFARHQALAPESVGLVEAGLRRVVGLGPRSVPAWAFAQLRLATEIWPESPSIWFFYGKASLLPGGGGLDESFRAYERGATLEPQARGDLRKQLELRDEARLQACEAQLRPTRRTLSVRNFAELEARLAELGDEEVIRSTLVCRAADSREALSLETWRAERLVRRGRVEQAVVLLDRLLARTDLEPARRAELLTWRVQAEFDGAPGTADPALQSQRLAQAQQLAPPGSPLALALRAQTAAGDQAASLSLTEDELETLLQHPLGILVWSLREGRAGRPGTAARGLERLRAVEGYSGRVTKLGVDLAMLRGDLAEARRVLAAGLPPARWDTRDAQLFSRWITTSFVAGDEAGVELWAERALRLGYDLPPAWLWRVHQLGQRGSTWRARAAARRLVGGRLAPALGLCRTIRLPEVQIQRLLTWGLAPPPVHRPQLTPLWREQLDRLEAGRDAAAEAVLGAMRGEGPEFAAACFERAARAGAAPLPLAAARAWFAWDRNDVAALRRARAELERLVAPGDPGLELLRAGVDSSFGVRELEALTARVRDPLLDLRVRLFQARNRNEATTLRTLGARSELAQAYLVLLSAANGSHEQRLQACDEVVGRLGKLHAELVAWRLGQALEVATQVGATLDLEELVARETLTGLPGSLGCLILLCDRALRLERPLGYELTLVTEAIARSPEPELYLARAALHAQGDPSPAGRSQALADLELALAARPEVLLSPLAERALRARLPDEVAALRGRLRSR